MPPSSDKRAGTAYNSQARAIIASVLQYFERERDNKGPLLDVKKVSERVAAACNISTRTLSRIRLQITQALNAEATSSNMCPDFEEVGQHLPPVGDISTVLSNDATLRNTNHTPDIPKLNTPKRKKPFKSILTELDDFQKTAIRNHVMNYYRRREVPTLRKLVTSLRLADLFHGSTWTLSKVLKNIGFKWNSLNNRKVLMEKPSVALARCRFLRKIRQIDFKKCIFLDETWINANISKDRGWTDGSVKCSVNAPLGKGKRLIICHAGGSDGWIKSPPLIFQSKKTVDYHEEMNHEVFETWFFEVLLKSIPEGSTIVMDNAPYHSRVANKAPTTASRKIDMEEWLRARNISFSADMLKPELYNLIKLHKPQVTSYEIDKKASQLGFKVIRLPPYHCNYNPIELVWAKLKGSVASRNTTFKLNDVQDLFMEAVSSFTPDEWRKCVEHVEKEIECDWEKEGLFDISVQELVITLAPGDSDDSDLEDDDDPDDPDDPDFGVAPLE